MRSSKRGRGPTRSSKASVNAPTTFGSTPPAPGVLPGQRRSSNATAATGLLAISHQPSATSHPPSASSHQPPGDRCPRRAPMLPATATPAQHPFPRSVRGAMLCPATPFVERLERPRLVKEHDLIHLRRGPRTNVIRYLLRLGSIHEPDTSLGLPLSERVESVQQQAEPWQLNGVQQDLEAAINRRAQPPPFGWQAPFIGGDNASRERRQPDQMRRPRMSLARQLPKAPLTTLGGIGGSRISGRPQMFPHNDPVRSVMADLVQ